MTKADSNSANNAQSAVTSTSLFHIALDAETTVDHLDQLAKMMSEKLSNLSRFGDMETVFSEIACTQTLLDALTLYLGKIGDSVEAIYQQSKIMPKTRDEIAAVNE